jgi:hypothetical protein
MADALPRTRLAALSDLDALAPLFDAYEQPADLELARTYLGERMARGEWRLERKFRQYDFAP